MYYLYIITLKKNIMRPYLFGIIFCIVLALGFWIAFGVTKEPVFAFCAGVSNVGQIIFLILINNDK